METIRNQSPDLVKDEDARREEALVALYMELTGANRNLARNVYAHLPLFRNLDQGSFGRNELLAGASLPAASEAGLAAEALYTLDWKLAPSTVRVRRQISSGVASAETVMSSPLFS